MNLGSTAVVSKKPNTVTIFDWDDTLFVTSAIKPYDEANLI